VTLRGTEDFEVAIITFGATVQALKVPDRKGRCADIVLGMTNWRPIATAVAGLIAFPLLQPVWVMVK
jgi:hypothetical protein